MTSFWLALSAAFKWSFGFFDLTANFLNWVFFLLASGFFTYWCYILVKPLGGQKDKDYFSPTEGKNPYYDTKIYKNEG